MLIRYIDGIIGHDTADVLPTGDIIEGTRALDAENGDKKTWDGAAWVSGWYSNGGAYLPLSGGTLTGSLLVEGTDGKEIRVKDSAPPGEGGETFISGRALSLTQTFAGGVALPEPYVSSVWQSERGDTNFDNENSVLKPDASWVWRDGVAGNLERMSLKVATGRLALGDAILLPNPDDMLTIRNPNSTYNSWISIQSNDVVNSASLVLSDSLGVKSIWLSYAEEQEHFYIDHDKSGVLQFRDGGAGNAVRMEFDFANGNLDVEGGIYVGQAFDSTDKADWDSAFDGHVLIRGSNGKQGHLYITTEHTLDYTVQDDYPLLDARGDDGDGGHTYFNVSTGKSSFQPDPEKIGIEMYFKADLNDIWLRTGNKDEAISQINSRLQIGFDQCCPDLDRPETLVVNGDALITGITTSNSVRSGNPVGTSGTWIKVAKFYDIGGYGAGGGTFLISGINDYTSSVYLDVGSRFDQDGNLESVQAGTNDLYSYNSTLSTAWAHDPTTQLKMIQNELFSYEIWINQSGNYKSPRIKLLNYSGPEGMGIEFFADFVPTTTEPIGSLENIWGRAHPSSVAIQTEISDLKATVATLKAHLGI